MSTSDLAVGGPVVAQEVATPPAPAFCGASLRTRKGNCRRPAGWGTDHSGWGSCKLHTGNTRSQVLHAAKLEVEAVAQRVMGARISIEPEDALQLCIDITHGEVVYCDKRIGELTDTTAAVPITSERIHGELDREGNVHELNARTAESTAQLHVWIVTRQGAVDRLARYSKMALDVGLEDRRVQIDERQADAIAGTLLAIFAQLTSLSDNDRSRIPSLLEQHLPGRLDPPTIEGTAS